MSTTMPVTDQHIQTVYQVYCTQFENIMSRRFQLLTIVPGSTVASFAITLFSDPGKTASLRHLVLPFGIAGTLFLIGLFVIVRISFRHGAILANRIQYIETSIWQVPRSIPHEDELFNQKIVATLIFSVSLAGWVCVALWFIIPNMAPYISGILIIPLFFASYYLLNTAEQPESNNNSTQQVASASLS